MRKDFYIKSVKRIKTKRLTQQQLADKINKGFFVGKIEVAFSKPSLDTLIDITEALKTDLSEFVKN